MNNVDNYINQLISFNNPVLYSLFFSIIIITIIMMVFFKVIFPMRLKFEREKRDLVLEKARLMALFAELDPDPSIRCGIDGEILQTNGASRDLFSSQINQLKIWDLLPGIGKNINEIVTLDKEISFLETVSGKNFAVNVRGNSSYNFANIYMHDITKMIEYENELEDYKDRLKNLAGMLESRFEKQRKEISSELHDDIGQKMVLLKMNLAQLNVNKDDKFYKELDQVYQRIRELSHSLRPNDIEEFGLKFSIQNLVNKIVSASGLNGEFSIVGQEKKINSELEMSLYRVAQESLTNIIKHSGATEFTVQLIYNEENTKLIVADNGKGIPEEYFQSKDLKKFGIGLFNMKERLENLNGKFKIHSIPNEGTSIIVNVETKGAEHEENSIVGS